MQCKNFNDFSYAAWLWIFLKLEKLYHELGKCLLIFKPNCIFRLSQRAKNQRPSAYVNCKCNQVKSFNFCAKFDHFLFISKSKRIFKRQGSFYCIWWVLGTHGKAIFKNFDQWVQASCETLFSIKIQWKLSKQWILLDFFRLIIQLGFSQNRWVEFYPTALSLLTESLCRNL